MIQLNYAPAPLFSRSGIGFVKRKCMEKLSHKNLTEQSFAQMRCASKAILFLRLFIGGVILLHVVGKMQTYDNLVLDFPSFLGFSHSTTLAITMIFESLFAAMIMIGVATRLVSFAMLLVTLLSIAQMMQMDDMTITALKLDFLYFGIYVTLLISGSGIYGFNVPWVGRKNVPNR